jgi:hypothetical protein
VSGTLATRSWTQRPLKDGGEGVRFAATYALLSHLARGRRLSID